MSSSPSSQASQLTQEQKARIEENRLKALQLKNSSPNSQGKKQASLMSFFKPQQTGQTAAPSLSALPTTPSPLRSTPPQQSTTSIIKEEPISQSSPASQPSVRSSPISAATTAAAKPHIAAIKSPLRSTRDEDDSAMDARPDTTPKAVPKRKSAVVESDDDDEQDAKPAIPKTPVFSTPKQPASSSKKSEPSSTARRRRIQDSDEEDEYQPDDDDIAAAILGADDDDDDDADDDRFIVDDDDDDDAPRPAKKKQPAKSSSSKIPTTPFKSPSTAGSAKTTPQKPDEKRYAWLVNPRDKSGKSPGEPDFDPSSLYVPPSAFVDKSLSPFEIQYWKIKKDLWFDMALRELFISFTDD